jgi:hypothetical protein
MSWDQQAFRRAIIAPTQVDDRSLRGIGAGGNDMARDWEDHGPDPRESAVGALQGEVTPTIERLAILTTRLVALPILASALVLWAVIVVGMALARGIAKRIAAVRLGGLRRHWMASNLPRDV